MPSPLISCIRKNRLLLPLLLSALLLGGCAGQQQPLQQAGDPYMAEHNRRYSQLTHWQITGKIRLKTEQSSDSANLQWQQNADLYRLTLSGPFGGTAARLDGSARQVTLTLPEEGVYSARTPESLLYRHFGWDLPLSHLFYWVRTLPAPDSGYDSELNPQQQLARLQQDGWTIVYDRYRSHTDTAGGDLNLPGRIKVSRGALELTLIVNRWQFPEPMSHLLQRAAGTKETPVP